MKRAPAGILPAIAVDRDSPRPLYRQLYEGYRDAIVERRLRGGPAPAVDAKPRGGARDFADPRPERVRAAAGGGLLREPRRARAPSSRASLPDELSRPGALARPQSRGAPRRGRVVSHRAALRCRSDPGPGSAARAPSRRPASGRSVSRSRSGRASSPATRAAPIRSSCTTGSPWASGRCARRSPSTCGRARGPCAARPSRS